MRVLHDEVGTGVDSLANDTVVQRTVPATVDGDLETLGDEGPGELLEPRLVSRQSRGARVCSLVVARVRQI